MKINAEQFLDISYAAETWYQVDVLLDWNTKHLCFFLDGDFIVRTPFYSLERDKQLACAGDGINRVSLYNLTPGVTSRFSDIELCSGICPETTPAFKPLRKDDSRLEGTLE